jgi:hypothetical protein
MLEQRVPYSGWMIFAVSSSLNSDSTAGAGESSCANACLMPSTSGASSSVLPEAVDAGLEPPRFAAAVGHPPELVAVARQQVEAAVEAGLHVLDVIR